MKDNHVTESELKAKSTGRRVTLESVQDAIASEHYFTAAQGVLGSILMDNPDEAKTKIPSLELSTEGPRQPLDLMTFCVLTLTNQYTVVGQSACADPTNYNKEIGQRLAREHAVRQIWPLMGFALRTEILSEQTLLSKRAFTERDDFGVFIGTKVVHAIPMSRAVYNDYRGWTMPENESDDPGYLVEYTDGGQANVEDMRGYVSWSPTGVFEKSYRLVRAGG